MTNAWSKLTPDDVKLGACEVGRVSLLGGEPPIRIIPKLSQPGDLPDSVTVSIKISEGIKESYNKFVGGSAEEALRHVLLF